MIGFTSTAPPDISVTVRNASTTLKIKIPTDTAHRCAPCQSVAWKRPSSVRRPKRRRGRATYTELEESDADLARIEAELPPVAGERYNEAGMAAINL